MYSYTEENYLKALFTIEDQQSEINVNVLSKHLGIKMPTVTNMIKKLAQKDLVNYESYKPLNLTEKGRVEAAKVIRKHRLTEMFLVEKMGFGWEEVHEIAEQIEHIKSAAFFSKMDQMLNYPTIDPHGSPIPDEHGKVKVLKYKKLSECTAGEKIKVTAVTNSSEEFLKYLNNKSINLGTVITIDTVEEYDGTMRVSYGEVESQPLGSKVTAKLLVVNQ